MIRYVCSDKCKFGIYTMHMENKVGNMRPFEKNRS